MSRAEIAQKRLTILNCSETFWFSFFWAFKVSTVTRLIWLCQLLKHVEIEDSVSVKKYSLVICIPWEPSSRDQDDDGLQVTSSSTSSMTSSSSCADDVLYRRFVMRKDRGIDNDDDDNEDYDDNYLTKL